ncbi:MAG: Fic family protein [Planctomycetaceae bacterium]|jgi:Fic family protein|nr:Fic family protein [Planctomycetaceae bacterium]
MIRKTGSYKTWKAGGETIEAFIPLPLPPRNPTLSIDGKLGEKHQAAMAALGRLQTASTMVPSPNWFLYGYVRKEAVVSSQIEGTESTLEDVVVFELNRQAKDVADVTEVCNYIDALNYARDQMNSPNGLPICTRLICNVHERLMRGSRGQEKQPGRIRTSQNWIGGTRPGNAKFVPPPPESVPELLASLDKWIHSSDQLPLLIKIGLAHVQFETIHPFLDGNGRVGRLLITLLTEFWKLLDGPFLYLSLGFKRHRQEYYRALDAVRTEGDWEAWLDFYLDCAIESAEDGTSTAKQLFKLVNDDRRKFAESEHANLAAMRLFERLPEQPMITALKTAEILHCTKPTATKAIESLVKADILVEITGRLRDRIYAYRKYLDVLGQDTLPIASDS